MDKPIISLHVKNLASAWTSCRAEQLQAVNKLFGMLSGRDQSFQQQVIVLLDNYKDLCLERVTTWLVTNVKHLRTFRLPHILNRLRIEFEKDFGLSGAEVASQDAYVAPPMPAPLRNLARDVFHNYFNPMEFVQMLTTQINESMEFASSEQVVTRPALLQWINLLSPRDGKRKFDEHTILFSQEESYLYDSIPKNLHDMFAHDGVTVDILNELFSQ